MKYIPNYIGQAKTKNNAGDETMDFLVQNAKQETQVKVGQANIKVIGSGGAGNNMVGWL